MNDLLRRTTPPAARSHSRLPYNLPPARGPATG